MSNTLMFGLGQLPDNYGKVYGLVNDALHKMSMVLVMILSRFIYGSTIYEAHIDSRFLFTVLYMVLLQLLGRACHF